MAHQNCRFEVPSLLCIGFPRGFAEFHGTITSPPPGAPEAPAERNSTVASGFVSLAGSDPFIGPRSGVRRISRHHYEAPSSPIQLLDPPEDPFLV